MSKRFTGELCAYCSKRSASGGDHIFARSFFLESARADLPQAPSCERCNNEKSKLEHYLATVVPFGGRHADAPETLASLVPGRLYRNRKLHQHLAANSTGQNIPFDGSSLERLFTLIARGLIWHHWKLYLNDEHHSIRCFVIGSDMFDEVFSRCHAAEHFIAIVGNGTFAYEGKRNTQDPARTIWRFSVFGGLVLSAIEDARPVQTRIVVMTRPKAEMDEPRKKT